MAINFTAAASAYQKAAQRDTLPAFDKAQKPEGGGFGEALREATEGAIDTMHESERQTLKAAIGQADLTEVVTAVSKAELTLQTVVTLRDRVVQAYQEILRMPI